MSKRFSQGDRDFKLQSKHPTQIVWVIKQNESTKHIGNSLSSILWKIVKRYAKCSNPKWTLREINGGSIIILLHGVQHYKLIIKTPRIPFQDSLVIVIKKNWKTNTLESSWQKPKPFFKRQLRNKVECNARILKILSVNTFPTKHGEIFSFRVSFSSGYPSMIPTADSTSVNYKEANSDSIFSDVITLNKE